MTEKQKAFRKDLIKRIHCTPAYARMRDDDAWASTLHEWYGVESSTKLSIDGLKNLLAVLRGEAKPKPDTGIKTAPNSLTALQKTAIENQWQRLSREKTPLALAKFCSKVTKREVHFINTLSKAEATKVLTALSRLGA